MRDRVAGLLGAQQVERTGGGVSRHVTGHAGLDDDVDTIQFRRKDRLIGVILSVINEDDFVDALIGETIDLRLNQGEGLKDRHSG